LRFSAQGYLLAPQARLMSIEARASISVEIVADAVHIMPD
jgi:hypothetical protein